MKKEPSQTSRLQRRTMLKSVCAAGALPWIVPASVLGKDGAVSPSNKVTLGVIGVGAQGQWDMRAMLNHKDVQVAAICDVNKRNLESARRILAESYGKCEAKVFSDFHALNADPSIDAVQMTLPVHWHSIPSLDAVTHGKHIYHEKPMAMSFEEAKRVREGVHRSGVVFQFGTQQRSDQYFRWACELARSGRLGKVGEIQVSVPGGRRSGVLPEQPVPDYVDWDRWVGPAPMTPFHVDKLARDWHENINNFSLGMISCWGIHHLDIAQWGNGTDATGPVSVEGAGEFPKEGTCNAIVSWKVRFEFATAAPVVFVNDGQGMDDGIRFIGEKNRWVHVTRGSIRAHDDKFLRDPENKPNRLPVKLPVSRDHTRNFIDAVKSGKRAICDVDTAVRSDTLCQIALIAVKQGRKLHWNPQSEQFDKDDAANAMLRCRPMRGPWRLG